MYRRFYLFLTFFTLASLLAVGSMPPITGSASAPRLVIMEGFYSTA